MSKKVIIIGGGFGGLGAAALLGKQGFDVTLFEKNNQVGGRASVYKKNGFVFDMGPSWYLMPDVFEHYFALFKKSPSDYYTLKRLKPSYRMFFGPEKVIDVPHSPSKTAALFDSLEKNGGEKFRQYLELSKYQYDAAMKSFIYKEYSSLKDILDVRLLSEGQKLRVFESIDSHVRRFFKSDIARKILEYNIVFLGGNPQNTPALYSIMAHIDFNLGVWYPDGGMGMVVDALRKLCESYGVNIRLNSNVKEFYIEHSTISKVKVNNKWHTADIILGNADLPFIETQLLDKKHQTYPASYWKKKTIAPSAFIMYLGIKGNLPQLKHHNLFFEDDWMKHFDQIFKDPQWPEEFSYYVSCPSKTDSNIAPHGYENIFILVPIASGITDTKELRKAFSKKVIKKFEEHLGTTITDRIVLQKIFAINDFAQQYNAYKGTALGLTHTLFQSALFRPHIKSKKVNNLYYVGQYTHPGIGVPMALISAEIVSNKIIQDYANL